MISKIDHVVLTTAHEQACIDFYTEILGMSLEVFVGGSPPVERKAFKFGAHKINLHLHGKEFEPKALWPTPGSLDLCFLADGCLDGFIAHLQSAEWPILEGPVQRTGATGLLRSVYIRDPDGNLIEISEEVCAASNQMVLNHE